MALRFFEAWAFRIDRDKSWSWTTADSVTDRQAQTFELHAAKLNLGCYQRYRKSNRHGNLADRLKEGAKRAKCIAALPFDTKARLQAIQAGPLQVALYGSEISYIGEKSIKGLRSATSKVLACSNHGTNHKVAILTYHGGICEPKIQLVLRAIRTARRAYWKFPEQYTAFISLMCANNGDCRKAWGPAGSLASYLHSLCITFDSHGFQVHLFRSGYKHLHDAPAIDPALTGHYIDKLGANEARTIRTFLSGSARHWANTDENCRLCGEVDTLAHRLQTCGATANARQQHQVLGKVDQLRAEAPWARSSPAGCQLTHLWDSLALPCVAATFDDGPFGRIVYTDGTCDHLKDTQIAQAAWSIVVEPTPGTGLVQATHAQLTRHIQEMQVLECGRPSGPQTIGQAELLAIAIAIARVRNIRVISDCKGAIDITHALLAGRGIHNYANHPNFDIVSLLDQAIRKWPAEERVIHLEKIKSHQQGPFSLDDVRKVAGNEAADIAAKQTLADTPPELRSLIHDARVTRTHEKTLVPELLSGAYAAVVMYLQALRKDGLLPRPIRERLSLPPASDVVFMDVNPLKITFTLAALKWLQMLKWPRDGCAAGQVTWIELLLSFKEQTGLAIPAPHPTVHGMFHSPGIHRVLHYEEKALGAESWSFNNFLRSLSTILGQEVAVA